MPRRNKIPELPAGTFEPALPTDPHEVLKLYAVAAKIACSLPEELDRIEGRMHQIAGSLVPPELAAAEECNKLWFFFKKAVASPKFTLRREAAIALYNDLDALGQRLELAPMTSWDRLPDAVRDASAAPEKRDITQTHITVDSIRRRAKNQLGKLSDDNTLVANAVGKMLKMLDERDLEDLFTQLVGAEIMGRAEGSMLVRWLAKGDDLSDDDEALVEFLVRLGHWLAA